MTWRPTTPRLIASFERIEAARGTTTLTFFEYNALAALDIFARAPVDVAVLEVGLGGRLDATNIVDADVGVICSIGLDHVDWLGDSVEQIGREKAGIFRAGRPAVLGSAALPRSVWRVIEELGAKPVAPGQHYRTHTQGERWDFEYGAVLCAICRCRHCRAHTRSATPRPRWPPLPQEASVSRFHRPPWRTPCVTVRIDGRFQRLPGEVEWILDVAHNVPAAETLRDNLRRLPRARRTLAVCGILGDKDIRGITQVLSADIDDWILVTLSGPRAVSSQQIAAQLPANASVLAHAGDVADACRTARAAARPGDRVLVFGSFLTVGPALEFVGL